MIFTLKIEIGNDAVQGETDVAMLLEGVALKLRQGLEFVGDSGDLTERKILDANGNSVGEWKVKESR